MLNLFLIPLYKKLDPYSLLFPNGIKKTLTIGNIELTVDKLDSGGIYYDSRKSFEECYSPLYRLIQKDYSPTKFLDIGANYGFISIIASKQFPQAEIFCIEPSKKLIPFIKENLKLNSIHSATIYNAVCGASDKDQSLFSINPSSSQDNRVVGENRRWLSQHVPMVQIDTLLAYLPEEESVFLKIDTQGYEEHVFKGGEKFMKSHKNWIAKSEFAPYWLKSQGSDPKKLLTYFVEHYDVTELGATTPFCMQSVDELFKNKIQSDSIGPFLKYITQLNKSGRGWVDLLIRPKKMGIINKTKLS